LLNVAIRKTRRRGRGALANLILSRDQVCKFLRKSLCFSYMAAGNVFDFTRNQSPVVCRHAEALSTFDSFDSWARNQKPPAKSCGSNTTFDCPAEIKRCSYGVTAETYYTLGARGPFDCLIKCAFSNAPPACSQDFKTVKTALANLILFTKSKPQRAPCSRP